MLRKGPLRLQKKRETLREQRLKLQKAVQMVNVLDVVQQTPSYLQAHASFKSTGERYLTRMSDTPTSENGLLGIHQRGVQSEGGAVDGGSII